MPRVLCCLLALALLVAVPVAAQQTGDVNRDYSINGGGAGGTSVVTTTVATPGVMTNAYSTLDGNAPILWVASPNANPGQLVVGGGPTNSIDIGTAPAFADITVLGNGLLPDFVNSLFVTLPAGSFSLAVTVPVVYAGSQIKLCMAHFAATGPLGFWVSQVHGVGFSLDPNLSPANPACSPGGLPLTQGDDTTVQVSLGFTFPFFGQNYSSLWVGSNGYLTAAAFTTYTESVTGFLGTPAKICPFWDDFNFTGSGGVNSFLTDNATTAEICWTNVPEFVTTNSNTFKCTLIAGAGSNLIIFDYGAMAAMDGLVGLSAGLATYTGQSLNLSVGPNAIAPTSSPHQLFVPPGTPNDLVGYQVIWVLDPSGFPVMQL